MAVGYSSSSTTQGIRRREHQSVTQGTSSTDVVTSPGRDSFLRLFGEDSVVGAGALVTERTVVPPKSLVLGSPAKVKRPVSKSELAWIRESAENYVRYAKEYLMDPHRTTPGFKL